VARVVDFSLPLTAHHSCPKRRTRGFSMEDFARLAQQVQTAMFLERLPAALPSISRIFRQKRAKRCPSTLSVHCLLISLMSFARVPIARSRAASSTLSSASVTTKLSPCVLYFLRHVTAFCQLFCIHARPQMMMAQQAEA
jgi:hypothetical protein